MRRLVVAIALVMTMACAYDKQAATDTLPVVPAADTGTKADCAVTGLWKQCLVLKRLEEMALAVHADSMTVVQESPLTIAGKRLPIARGELLFFIYADTASRSRDQAKLDKTQFIPPGGQPGITRQRTLIANQNLLAIMSVVNEANQERIGNALMAGPPQPSKHIP